MATELRLEGASCAVRGWRMLDAEALVRHANNAKIARQLRDRFPHPYTRHAANTFLKHVLSTVPVTNFAVEIDGEAVGGIGFVPGTDVERYSAEIGYWLSEACWGRGVATEAVRLVTKHAFEKHNLLRLFALPFADNMASVRVLEKSGYAREGLLRASSVKFGKPRDQLLFAIINAGWEHPRMS